VTGTGLATTFSTTFSTGLATTFSSTFSTGLATTFSTGLATTSSTGLATTFSTTFSVTGAVFYYPYSYFAFIAASRFIHQRAGFLPSTTFTAFFFSAPSTRLYFSAIISATIFLSLPSFP